MLAKHILETLYASEEPYGFLSFLVALYEIPKRKVDVGLSKAEKKGLFKLYDAYFAEHGLPYVNIQGVCDSFVHRIDYTGDLYTDLCALQVEDIMPYVRYHELNISQEDILRRLLAQRQYVKSLCDKFGEVYSNSAYKERSKQK